MKMKNQEKVKKMKKINKKEDCLSLSLTAVYSK